MKFGGDAVRTYGIVKELKADMESLNKKAQEFGTMLKVCTSKWSELHTWTENKLLKQQCVSLIEVGGLSARVDAVCSKAVERSSALLQKIQACMVVVD